MYNYNRINCFTFLRMNNKLGLFYKQKSKYTICYCPVFPFYTPWKHVDVFQGLKKETLGSNGLMKLLQVHIWLVNELMIEPYPVNIIKQSFLFKIFLILSGYLLSVLLTQIKVPSQMRVITIKENPEEISIR